jgi:hypothetical protein
MFPQPAKPEDWPIDPRFPGTNVPTPEALVKAAQAAGVKIERRIWIGVERSCPCGCAAGTAAMLVPGTDPDDISLMFPFEGIMKALSCDAKTLAFMSHGFEGEGDDSLASDWGREVADLAGLDQDD